MKKILLSLVLVFALVACSTEETVEENNEPQDVVEETTTPEETTEPVEETTTPEETDQPVEETTDPVEETPEVPEVVEPVEVKVQKEVVGMATMTVEVTLVDGVITMMEVIEHSETPGIGAKVIDEGILVQAIIDNQTNLDAVDVISGATMTSNALIEAARLALAEVQ